MNLEKILAQYDAMFGKNSLEEIEKFLVDTIAKAKEQSEMGIVISLLNEIIGFCMLINLPSEGFLLLFLS